MYWQNALDVKPGVPWDAGGRDLGEQGVGTETGLQRQTHGSSNEERWGAWGDQKQIVQGKIGMACPHLPIHSCQSPAAVLPKLMAIMGPTPREGANGGGGPGPRGDPSWRGKKTRRSTEPSPLLPGVEKVLHQEGFTFKGGLSKSPRASEEPREAPVTQKVNRKLVPRTKTPTNTWPKPSWHDSPWKVLAAETNWQLHNAKCELGLVPGQPPLHPASHSGPDAGMLGGRRWWPGGHLPISSALHPPPCSLTG